MSSQKITKRRRPVAASAATPLEDCRWIDCPEAGPVPLVTAYRLRFRVKAAERVAIDVTADERYELFLDGRRIGRGSERGDGAHWFFETYKLTLTPGAHVLVARVWSLGAQAPFAQLSVQPGFFVQAHGCHRALLGTGHAPWEAKRLTGYTFTSPSFAWGTGANLDIDGSAFAWGFEKGQGEGWQPAGLREHAETIVGPYGTPPRRSLHPATLPAMLEKSRPAGCVRHMDRVPGFDTHLQPVLAAQNLTDEVPAWQHCLDKNKALTIPPHSSVRVLIDITDYCCAYPEVVVSKGRNSKIRLQWAEALFLESEGHRKGHRDEIEGRFFIGVGDIFRPDGGAHRRFETLWWQAGRYLELVVITAAEPLVFERLTLRETRYPMAMESRFTSSDKRLASVIPMGLRSLQMCMHETYMDCPYYEQLMYVGDTRLECLATYTLTSDARLPRKALALFDGSRNFSGLTQSRYPTRDLQLIPPFSLWWVAMVSDYSQWRDDSAYVAQRMPGVRAVLDCFLQRMGPDQLLAPLHRWNFVDWVPGWDAGVPPKGNVEPNGILNWHLVYTLRLGARLELAVGEPHLARRLTFEADRLAAAATAAFWDEKRGLFADDLGKTQFSEHCQCLALLADGVQGERRGRLAKGFLEATDLARTTIYFSHYLFEAYRMLGRVDCLLNRMSLWFDAANFGFKTTPEAPEPSRSECHAWGAHPLYHYFATILGIRPAGPGFRRVSIAPQLGPLEWASGTLPHPLGTIQMEVQRKGRKLSGWVKLPKGLDHVQFVGWRPKVTIS